MLTRYMKDAITLAILTLAFAANGHADILTLKSGEDFDGVIRQIADGKVQMQMGTEVRTFNVLDVDAIEFNTPHLLDSADRALDHFLTDLDAQEVVENFAELETTREEISEHMDAARTEWTARQPIAPEEEEAWDRAREDFARPLSRYQEVLGDLYFHVLAKVDEYNRLAREADDIYVGVRGAFNVGASLLPDGEGELQPEGYVPASWYDMIFYEGYRRGYEDAYPAEGYPDDQPEE